MPNKVKMKMQLIWLQTDSEVNTLFFCGNSNGFLSINFSLFKIQIENIFLILNEAMNQHTSNRMKY